MKAKKWLGQNFLKNKITLREIADAAEISSRDTILEIGPGHGELTEILASRAKKIVAVEKDADLIRLLREKFQKQKNVKILQGDILKFHLGYSDEFLGHSGRYKIVANLPYYITSRFLRIFLSDKKLRPALAVLMLQYEVAKRICARPPEMNLLALSVQAYGRPKFVKKVSKKYFSPEPKVDSGIIKISEISDRWFKQNDIAPEKFFEILQAAFRQKRKMLRHSLKKFPIPEIFSEKRPQELPLEDWKKLINYRD
ncbi:ribosomal RNA small subunit methyltransferase A [Candidatus Giovannonibacteria bacterium]|nr:ribosomal RNA small subunit methyltransferase A [Candidatus Giovannonibacteria bacterium]